MGLSSHKINAIEPLYETLARAAESVPGWTPVEQLLALYSAVALNRSISGDIVEVGAWCGRSTIALGLAALSVGCRVHTVDLFPEREDWKQNTDGSWSINMQIEGRRVAGCLSHTVWDEAFQREVLPIYAEGRSPRTRLEQALKEFGVQDAVTVHRGTAQHFVQRDSAPSSARLLFLDGDHSEEAVKADVDALLPLLLPGGLLCFDDAFTGYAGVDRAVADTLAAGGELFDLEPIRITRKLFIIAKRRAADAGASAR